MAVGSCVLRAQARLATFALVLCVALSFFLRAAGATTCDAANWLDDVNRREWGEVTPRLQKAIDDCHKRNPLGSTLQIPRGDFAVGSLVLPSNFTLSMRGSRLFGTGAREAYPLIEPLPSYGCARDNAINTSLVHRPLLYANGSDNLRITGSAGSVVDGGGGVHGWWQEEENHTLPFQRPRLVQIRSGHNISIDGPVSFQNSAFWTIHLVYSDQVTVRGVYISAPRDSPNTDGVDVDSTTSVVIAGCTIDVGDDAVAIKSGLNWFGREVGLPSAHIIIENNRIWGKAIAIGSEMSGSVYNVTARNNLMGDPKGSVTGLLIKSQRPRGSFVRDILFKDNHMLNASRVYSWIPAIIITDHYKNGKPGNASATPRLENISFVNIRVDFAEQAGCMSGLPEAPLSGIHFENVSIGAYNTGWACNDCLDCPKSICDAQSWNRSCAF